MHPYDRLPKPLRQWMAEAARPWSPASCLRLWRRAVSEGASVDTALNRLDRTERALLARDRPHLSG